MKTTLRNAINLFGNLRSLNGREVAVEGGDKRVLFQPYQFDAKTVWIIAKDMNLLKPHVEVFETARGQLLKNLGDDVNADPEKRKKFTEGVNQMLDEEVTIEGIAKISLAGLQLDKNAIQPGLLADLAEIIEE